MAFELLRQTRRPAFEQTSLEELARVVVASVGFAAAAIALLACVQFLTPNVLIDIGVLAKRGSHWYWQEHPARVLGTIALEAGLATALAFTLHRSLNHPERKGLAIRVRVLMARLLRHQPGEQVERFPVWRTLFRDARPVRADTKLTVLKKDGTLITGLLASYSANGAGDERDLALGQPIEVLRQGDKRPRQLAVGWPLMLINAGEISEIFVTWPPTAAATASRPPVLPASQGNAPHCVER